MDLDETASRAFPAFHDYMNLRSSNPDPLEGGLSKPLSGEEAVAMMHLGDYFSVPKRMRVHPALPGGTRSQDALLQSCMCIKKEGTLCKD